MLVKFQYTDFSTWEGPPEDGDKSPDKGIIRMIVTDDLGYVLKFTYKDIYYFYQVEDGWLFGGCVPFMEFIIKPNVAGCSGDPKPFELPNRAIVRHGETVSQEDAVKFGLIEAVDKKTLQDKKHVKVKRCEACDG